jgi:hypothetical protein
MSQLENKYVLGGLTLKDFKDEIRDFEVRIDDIHYVMVGFLDDVMELWETPERCFDNEPADRTIDLGTPVKVRDGDIIIFDDLTGYEETISLGRTEFVKKKVEIA